MIRIMSIPMIAKASRYRLKEVSHNRLPLPPDSSAITPITIESSPTKLPSTSIGDTSSPLFIFSPGNEWLRYASTIAQSAQPVIDPRVEIGRVPRYNEAIRQMFRNRVFLKNPVSLHAVTGFAAPCAHLGWGRRPSCPGGCGYPPARHRRPWPPRSPGRGPCPQPIFPR
jgi:hypothetical protein